MKLEPLMTLHADLNEIVQTTLNAGETPDFGDTCFVTQPRFETGNDRYKWLNPIMTVGEGRPLVDAVEYRIYEVTM